MSALNPENTPEQTPEPVQAPEPITDEKKREKLNIAMGNLSKKEMIYLINLLDMQPLPQEKKKQFFYAVNKVLVLIKNGKFPIKQTDKKGKMKTTLLKNYKGITLRERIMIRNNIANLFLDTADPEFRNPFYYTYKDGKKIGSLLMTDKKQIVTRIYNTVVDQKRLQMLILYQFKNLIAPFRGFHFDKSNQTKKSGGRKKRRKQKKKTKRRRKTRTKIKKRKRKK